MNITLKGMARDKRLPKPESKYQSTSIKFDVIVNSPAGEQVGSIDLSFPQGMDVANIPLLAPVQIDACIRPMSFWNSKKSVFQSAFLVQSFTCQRV